MLKKPGCRENTHSVFEGFFCANVHFEAKPIKVVGKEGDTSFNVCPELKKM